MTPNVNRRKLLQSVAGASTAGLLAGCIGGGEGGGDDTLRIGLTMPLSGTYADVGENNLISTETTIDLWADENGGEIETFVRDTEADPTAATQVAQELIAEEDVHMLSGSYSSAAALAIAEVAQQQQTPYLTTAGTTEITGGSCQRYAFATNPTTYSTSYAIAQFALENLGNTFYSLVHNYTAGITGHEATEEIVADGGGEVIGSSLVDLGQTDVTSEVSAAINSGADILITNIFGSDLAPVLSQARSFNAYDEMDVVCSSIDLESMAGIDPEIIEGAYGTPQGWWTQEQDEFQNMFLPEFLERLDRPPGMGAPNIFPAIWTGLDVMHEIESFGESEEFVRELEGREWVFKTYGEDRDGQYFRECDHRCPVPIPIAEAQPADEVEDEFDYLDLFEYVPAEEAFQDCEEAGCELPDY